MGVNYTFFYKKLQILAILRWGIRFLSKLQIWGLKFLRWFLNLKLWKIPPSNTFLSGDFWGHIFATLWEFLDTCSAAGEIFVILAPLLSLRGCFEGLFGEIFYMIYKYEAWSFLASFLIFWQIWGLELRNQVSYKKKNV